MTGSVNASLLRRAAVLGVFLLVAIGALGGRILAIQTASFEKYQKKVIEQLTTESPASANRGEIYDSSGNLLATNVTTYRVFLSPSGISLAQKALDGKKTNSIAEKIARALSELLNLDYETVYGKTQKTGRLDETVVRRVDEATAAILREWILAENMEHLVFLEATDVRYYPYGSLASHVIGFTSADGVGLYGLEYQYNEKIDGEDGYYVTARDSRGNELPSEYQSYVPAKDGYHLTTTLDVFVQAALEEQLENAVYDSNALNRACGIVMNVKTGAILALAVYPEYDLNDPWKLVDYYQKKLDASGYAVGDEEYSALARQYLLESWSNKVLTETYIPGSTFKILTSSMALEEDLPILNSSVFCGGSKTVLGKNIHCHKRKGHGSLTFAEGIQHSCNVWFMTIGQHLGIDNFAKYFKQFGYREKTGIDLPGEGMGVISPRMSELDLAIYSFGQNFTVTAIQHITAIAAIANGGELLEPYLVERITDTGGEVVWEHERTVKRTVVNPETSKTLSAILAAGVAGEGGAKNAYVAGYRIAAKTGTSEKKGVTTTGTEMYICSCVGYAPADDPEYAMIIMVDEPSKGILYGSTVAAPYIASAFETILPYLGIEPIYTEAEEAARAKQIPNYVGLPVDHAVLYAESRGLAVEVVGDGAYVRSQTPNGDSLYSGVSGKVVLYTDEEAQAPLTTVPDVVGKTVIEANKSIVDAGFNIKVEGALDLTGTGGAVVYSQFPLAGVPLEKGAVVTVTLRYMQGDE